MTATQYLLSISVAVLLAAGQFLFKVSAVRWESKTDSSSPILALLSLPFFASLAIYGIATLLWIYVLRTAPLSKAYIFVLAGAVLVPIGANVVFKEPLSISFWFGFALILTGLFLATK